MGPVGHEALNRQVSSIGIFPPTGNQQFSRDREIRISLSAGVAQRRYSLNQARFS